MRTLVPAAVLVFLVLPAALLRAGEAAAPGGGAPAARGPAEAGGGADAGVPPEGELPAEFLLADGSRVRGSVAAGELAVHTCYGKLAVPLSEVIRLRVARGGETTGRERIAGLVKQLGSPNFQERERAKGELLRVGAPALEQIRAAVLSSDPEVAIRAEELLTSLEFEAGGEEGGGDASPEAPLKGSEDEVVTSRFTLRGGVQAEKFLVLTPYGRMAVPKDQIIWARFAAPDTAIRTFKVNGAHVAGKMLNTQMALKAGDKVKIRATGNIEFKRWNHGCSPEGDNNYWGNWNDDIPTMALIARIGEGQQPFKIGASADFAAEATGPLFLGIAYNSDVGSSSGEYSVTVTVLSSASR